MTSQLDAGLFFLAFQRDPRTQFVAIQNRLGESDALNEYIKHTGSALFAIPPGVPAAAASSATPCSLSTRERPP